MDFKASNRAVMSMCLPFALEGHGCVRSWDGMSWEICLVLQAHSDQLQNVWKLIFLLIVTPGVIAHRLVIRCL